MKVILQKGDDLLFRYLRYKVELNDIEITLKNRKPIEIEIEDAVNYEIKVTAGRLFASNQKLDLREGDLISISSAISNKLFWLYFAASITALIIVIVFNNTILTFALIFIFSITQLIAIEGHRKKIFRIKVIRS